MLLAAAVFARDARRFEVCAAAGERKAGDSRLLQAAGWRPSGCGRDWGADIIVSVVGVVGGISVVFAFVVTTAAPTATFVAATAAAAGSCRCNRRWRWRNMGVCDVHCGARRA